MTRPVPDTASTRSHSAGFLPDIGAGAGLGVTTHQVEVVRGVLIILVVLGHAGIDAGPYLDARAVAYNFHAVGFLVLPFLFPVRPLTWTALRDRFVRYYVPLLWFSASAFVMNALVIRAEPAWLTEGLPLFGLSLATGNQYFFNAATELALFWFLPALFGLYLWRALWPLMPALLRWILALAALTLFLVAGYYRHTLVFWPTALTISVYTLCLGPLCIWAIRAMHRAGRAGLALAVAGFALAAVVTVLGERHYNIAQLVLPDFRDPVGLLLYPVIISCAIVAILRLAPLVREQGLLSSFGRHSLGIYLSHIFFFAVLERAVSAVLDGQTENVERAIAILGALVLSLAFTATVRRSTPLRRLIFPRGAGSRTSIKHTNARD